MRMLCHVLPHEVADGPANMALDEALLNAVASGGDPAYLRTYGWAIPTLSLGYFQHVEDVPADPRWHAVPLVRRLTGGGAIWHHHEMTYAVILPADHPLARPRTALYRAVHTAIAAILADLGVRAVRRGPAVIAEPVEQKRSFLCFTDRNPEDIVCDGIKVVGSAQRRRAGAILQHGSVLLAQSSFVPELLGVCDVAGVLLDSEDWSSRLVRRIPGALGLEALAGAVPEGLRAQAAELEGTRYRNPVWARLHSPGAGSDRSAHPQLSD
jgi:lipoate-protein ligase A